MHLCLAIIKKGDNTPGCRAFRKDKTSFNEIALDY